MSKDQKEIKVKKTETLTTMTFEVTVVRKGAKSKKFTDLFSAFTKAAKIKSVTTKVLSTKTETKTIEETKQISTAHLRADNRAIKQVVKEAAEDAGWDYESQSKVKTSGKFQMKSSFKPQTYNRLPWIRIDLCNKSAVHGDYSVYWSNPKIHLTIDGEELTCKHYIRFGGYNNNYQLNLKLKFADADFKKKLTTFIELIGKSAKGTIKFINLKTYPQITQTSSNQGEIR